MLVKILGGIDLIAAFSFLTFIFGFEPFLPLIIFSAGLLFLKSLFIFAGDILSFLDLFSSILLAISIFFLPPMFLLWATAFLLLGKGIVSFI